MTDNKFKKFKSLAIYILLFFSIWAIYEIGIAPYIENNYSENILAFFKFFIKLFIWIVPVFLYLKFHDKIDPLSYLKLKYNIKQGLIGALGLSLIFITYNGLRAYLIGNLKLDVSLSINTWINGIVFVGLTEEIVFRGFFLKKLWDKLSFKKAMIVSSLLFVFIHYPVWFVKGNLVFPNLIFSSIYIFVIGILEAYIFKKTDSLWACIISHSIHNLIAYILFK
ncbi:hypothetical protein BX659_1583 [Orenia metallireducens]|uniref:CAAX prenyl protease 2/Lysostaphin resistance protein A-like domain-containing protein n=1 Tax=Orenia metallireducens TaxID=1413210 RepID=A0A285IIE9_9FIRM|nr:type II CAAX endopeptidase family protein [Orenia metallireducens]PRX16938.1 hypothetical protein BX659_1583 [Orenia metallireducens]SNY47780.1 hypothetical protein SAMN06265827_1583 [Orenia metallireducens]